MVSISQFKRDGLYDVGAYFKAKREAREKYKNQPKLIRTETILDVNFEKRETHCITYKYENDKEINKTMRTKTVKNEFKKIKSVIGKADKKIFYTSFFKDEGVMKPLSSQPKWISNITLENLEITNYVRYDDEENVNSFHHINIYLY